MGEQVAALVYALYDPRCPDNIRYIGWTIHSLRHRMNRHLTEARRKPPTCHRLKWIRSLLEDGVRPEARILVETTADKAPETERLLIAEYRAAGYRLTNNTDGGDGSFGFKHSDETKAELSRLAKGNSRRRGTECTLETRRKISRANKGKKRSPEVKAKLSLAGKGRKFSEAHKAKLAQSLVGNKRGLGNKGNTGRVWSEELKEHWSSVKSGENGPNAKLTWEKVHRIRELHAAGGITHRVLADEYGVCEATISNLINGITWNSQEVI